MVEERQNFKMFCHILHYILFLFFKINIRMLILITIYFLSLVSLGLTGRISCIGNQFSRICGVAWRNDKDNEAGSDIGRPECTETDQRGQCLTAGKLTT